MSDIQNFLFEGLPVRGALVKLTDAWQEILARHRQGDKRDQEHQGEGAPSAENAGTFYLPAVSELLGEMSAAAVLLQSMIKFDGSLELQIRGNGPMRLAVVEVLPDFALRATAKVQGDVPAMGGVDVLCNPDGQGRCAITLNSPNKEDGQNAYQGIVPLCDTQGQPLAHLNQVIEGYMMQSEQLPSCLILAADDKQAAGLLVQRIPVEGENNLGASEREAADEHFNRIAILTQSLRRDELLNLNGTDILRRLFWQEDVRLFDAQHPYFRCSCSKDRVAQMLQGLGEDEIKSILEEQERVEVGCDFCGALYHFDAVDASRLFIPEQDHPPASEELQ